jgi:hypothetical protein
VRMLSRKAAVLSAALIVSAGAVFGQQEAGDKEIGLAGGGSITHSSPVTGTIFAAGTFGKYLTQSQYIGVAIIPLITFGGTSSGTIGYTGNYRYLFGKKDAKVWPFVGASAGGFTTKGGGGFGSGGGGWSTLGIAAGEVGFKYYASQKTSFEVSYQLNVAFGGGVSGGFSERTLSLIAFGFKHIF